MRARVRVTFAHVSTRALIAAALATGLVILMAFAVRVLLWL